MSFPERIIRVSLFAIVSVVPFLSWKGFLFPSTFVKTSAFFILVEVALLCWLFSFRRHRRELFFTPLLFSVAVFFIVLAFSSIVGVDPYHSFWSNYERMMGLWTWLHIGMFFIIVLTTCTVRDIYRLLASYAVAATIVGVLGISEHLWGAGDTRIESTFFNAAFLASYMLFASGISAMFAISERTLSWRAIGWLLSFIVLSLTVAFTETRGAMLALMAGVLVVFFGVFLKAPHDWRALSLSGKNWKRVGAGGIIAVFFLAGAVALFRDSLVTSSFGPLSRVAGISFSDRTVEGRFRAWGVSFEGWKERPFLGWGIENYHLLFNAHYDPELFTQEPWYDRAHNILFDLLATQGLIGASVYIGMFFVAWWVLRTSYREGKILFSYMLGCWLILSSYLVNTFFVFETLFPLIGLMLVFATIHQSTREVAVRGDERAMKKSNKLNISSQAFLPGVVGGILVTALLYVGVWKPVMENYFGRLGYDAFAKGDDQVAMEHIKRALSYDTYGDIDVRRGVAEYVFDFLKAGGKRDPVALERVIDYAILKMEENINEDSKNVKWRMYEGELANLGAALLPDRKMEYADRARQRFDESLVLSPGRIQIYLEIAQARKMLGDMAGVWGALEAGARLLPEYRLPHSVAAVYAIELGDRSRETTEIAWLERESWPFADTPEKLLYQSTGEDFQMFRDAYFRVGRFSDAADFQERFIAFTVRRGDGTYVPHEVASMYATLASIRKSAGHYAEARGAALRAVELNPNERVSAEAFIRTLPFVAE